MINKSFVLCVCLTLFVFTQISCAKKNAYSTTSAVYKTDDNATITMRAVGVGASQQDAVNNAEMNVFDVILFRGVAQSKQKMALVSSDESYEMMKNSPYFTEFYNGKRYKSFIVNSSVVGGFNKLKDKKFETTVDVKVNVVNLRRDLEQNGVIRKFGF